jgi:hypothetical protein
MMPEDKDNPRFLLEQKIASLNTVANVGMTWWVSSIIFCGSIFAAVWLYRGDLVESGIMKSLGRVLLIFFLGVIVFGGLIIVYLCKVRKEISALSAALGGKGYFSIELNFFISAMIVGTLSFLLIAVVWIFLYTGLSAGTWRPKAQPNNSVNPASR